MDSSFYNKKRKLIESQICDRQTYDMALTIENQKHFPFYDFTNFNTSQILKGGRTRKHEPLICDYCNESFETNFAGYYSAYIVWESICDLRICCNVYHCRKGTHPLTFSQQETGFNTPLELGNYAESPDHKIIMSVFFPLTGSSVYDLNRFKSRGLTINDFNAFCNSSYHGGSRPDGSFYEWRNNVLEYGNKKQKQSKKLTKSNIVSLLNDILFQKKMIVQLELSFL